AFRVQSERWGAVRRRACHAGLPWRRWGAGGGVGGSTSRMGGGSPGGAGGGAGGAGGGRRQGGGGIGGASDAGLGADLSKSGSAFLASQRARFKEELDKNP